MRLEDLETHDLNQDVCNDSRCILCLIFWYLLTSHLMENSRSVLMLVEAGNVLTDPAARRLVFRRDVDLILQHKRSVDLKSAGVVW